MSPVDYHGWTHLPKEDGGTDPIPGLTIGEGGAADPTPWAIARNNVTATNVGSSTSWTTITLSATVATGQTALSAVTNGIQIDEHGIYIVVLSCRWTSAGGAGTWAQAAIKIDNVLGTELGRLPSQKASPIAFSDEDVNALTRIYSMPGEQGNYPILRVAARQLGGATQTPQVLLSVVQLTSLHNGNPPFAWA